MWALDGDCDYCEDLKDFRTAVNIKKRRPGARSPSCNLGQSRLMKIGCGYMRVKERKEGCYDGLDEICAHNLLSNLCVRYAPV